MHDNLTVNGLWIEGRLSLLELLTLKSFTAHGHRFVLWAYGEIPNELPAEIEVRDAAEVVPRGEVFCYRRGPHPGSYAGFSDIFRYKLLYERGGWWVDMDVTCLKPFDFPQPYVFRPHEILDVVGNMIKVPPRSELMLRCYQWAAANVDADNTDWHKPIMVLNTEIVRLGLRQYRIPAHCVTRECKDGLALMRTGVPVNPQWYCIHWCNGLLRDEGLDKTRPRPRTTYRRLLVRHGLV